MSPHPSHAAIQGGERRWNGFGVMVLGGSQQRSSPLVSSSPMCDPPSTFLPLGWLRLLLPVPNSPCWGPLRAGEGPQEPTQEHPCPWPSSRDHTEQQDGAPKAHLGLN